jgi:hypothetical protein
MTTSLVEAVRIGSIVIRCVEFEKMLHFWQQALGKRGRLQYSSGWRMAGIKPSRISPPLIRSRG